MALWTPSRRRVLKAAGVALTAPALLGGWGVVGSLPCDIYVILGDSNTYSGFAADGTAGYNPAIDVTNTRCLQCQNPFQNAGKSTVNIAKDQFLYNPNPQATGNFAVGSIGCGLTLMRDGILPSLPAGRNVMVIPCGVGGTTSSAWTTGGGNPSIATRIAFALGLNAANVVKAFITVLGTNDAIGSVSGATYTTNMTTIATNCRAISGCSGAAMIFVGLVDGWSAGTSTDIRAAIAALPSSISKSAAVNMTGLTGQTSGGVIYHFTAASQRLIGNPGIPNALANLSL